MDGVIYHGNQILPGVKEFIDWLYREDKKFLFLTNNSGKTPQELQEKLSRMGLHVDSSHFYTSALATANFIATQTPNAKVFVIGEPGLYNALYEKGIILDDTSPDYVVIGESYSYNYSKFILRILKNRQDESIKSSGQIVKIVPTIFFRLSEEKIQASNTVFF